MPTRLLRRARTYVALTVLTTVALLVPPTSPAFAAVDSMTVNFALNGGSPTYRASGFIYGVSTDTSAPPVSMTDQIKVKLMRAGGSQIGCPNGGWVNGAYDARWNFMRSYYSRAQRTGAKVEIILAALWGSDGVCNVPRWPGDNGDWSDYTNFINRIIDDVQAAGMTGTNVRWDMWNEPNIFFWGRSQAQYFEMIRRGTLQIRAALPGAVIMGPSCACSPSNSWFSQYLDYVRANNVVPNILSWHALPGDPAADASTANSLLAARGMSVQGFSVNEYGAFGAEQQPGPSAWYIARLERCNCDGARANWGMVGQTPSLYDTLGWLTTPNAGQPMGQWWVYKRYADQTGVRTSITPGSSHDGVVFQDSGARQSIAIYGARAGAATGAIDIRYNNIPSWLVTNGSVNVKVERMPSTNAYVGAPTVVSNSPRTVSGNSILVTIDWTNANDAYAITLTPPSGTPAPVQRLRSYNFGDRYVRHINFDARIDPNVSPVADAQWRIVPGLANSGPGYVSFESVNYPGYYLRHSNFDFALVADDGSSLFRSDATFRQVPGLADSSAVSFQSYNFPDRYIRHYNYFLRLDPISTAIDRADATFWITS